MINAKEELLDALRFFVKDKNIIKCAQIEYKPIEEDKEKVITLRAWYSLKDLENFFNELDFEYYESYGLQELYGTVWLYDGAWLSRADYDGSEWWVYNKLPEIPEECLK